MIDTTCTKLCQKHEHEHSNSPTSIKFKFLHTKKYLVRVNNIVLRLEFVLLVIHFHFSTINTYYKHTTVDSLLTKNTV